MLSNLEHQLLAWPHERWLQSEDKQDPLAQVASLLHQQCWREAESKCLVGLADASADQREVYLWMLCLLYCNSFNPRRAQDVYRHALSLAELSLPWIYLGYRILAACPDLLSSPKQEDLISPVARIKSDSIYVDYAGIIEAFSLKKIDLICHRLELCRNKETLEYSRFYSRYLLLINQPEQSLDLLFELVEKVRDHWGFWLQLCETALAAQDSERVLFALNKVHALLGDHPRVLPLILQVKLLQRQPSIARRSALLLRVQASRDLSRLECTVANQITSFEACGNVEWFPNLLPQFLDFNSSGSKDAAANMIYHLSSVESSLSERLAGQTIRALGDQAKSKPIPEFPLDRYRSRRDSSSLRVAWVTPDV